MLLEYYDIIESESTLRFKCKTKISGTHPLNAVACCKSYELDCYIDSLDLNSLKILLNDGFHLLSTFSNVKMRYGIPTA